MTRISGYTYTGTPNDQLRYVSTKIVASGATALVCSLEDVNVTLSAGEINVSAFRNTSDTPTDAYLYANGESLAAVSELWEGFGGFDATANVFRALSIVLDDSAMPVTPAMLPIGGEYRAAATVYTDGDATVLQSDINGNLKVTQINTEYIDDSTGFTLGTSKGNAFLAISDDVSPDSVNEGDIGILRMTNNRKLWSHSDGFYNATTDINLNPESTGLIFHQAAAAPAITDQVIRTTGGSNVADALVAANIWGLDSRALGYSFNGTTWDRVRSAVPNTQAMGMGLTTIPARYLATPVAITDTFSEPLLLDSYGKLSTIFNGVYTAVTNAIPSTSGLIVSSDAAAPDSTTQTVRATGGTNAADALVAANIFSINTRDFAYQFNGTTWDRVKDIDAASGLTLAGTLDSFTHTAVGMPNTVIMGYDSTGAANAYRAVHVDTSGNIILSSDIEIGAVELKNGADDARGIIKDGSTFATTDVALGVSDKNTQAAIAASSIAIPTTIAGGTQTVTTAGARVALAGSTVIKTVSIRAAAANLGTIYVGGITVTSANGIALAANDQTEFNIANLATVYIDASIDAQSVGFTYFS